MSAVERFKALSHREQTKILDKYRDWNTDHDWWDAVYEHFIEDMTERGISIDTKGKNSPAIYFTGFWSQGDGACFEGHISDWSSWLQDFPMIRAYQKKAGLSMSWTSDGNYCHSYTLRFHGNLDAPSAEDLGFEGLRAIAHEQAMGELADEWERLQNDVEVKVRGFCDNLYSDLEKEYDYLTSDETVIESLEANGMFEEIMEEYEDA